jgi:hypothetical protein
MKWYDSGGPKMPVARSFPQFTRLRVSRIQRHYVTPYILSLSLSRFLTATTIFTKAPGFVAVSAVQKSTSRRELLSNDFVHNVTVNIG